MRVPLDLSEPLPAIGPAGVSHFMLHCAVGPWKRAFQMRHSFMRFITRSGVMRSSRTHSRWVNRRISPLDGSGRDELNSQTPGSTPTPAAARSAAAAGAAKASIERTTIVRIRSTREVYRHEARRATLALPTAPAKKYLVQVPGTF